MIGVGYKIENIPSSSKLCEKNVLEKLFQNSLVR